MQPDVLEIRRVDQTLAPSLGNFFRALREAGDDVFFFPHPLDKSESQKIADYQGKDVYLVLIRGGLVLGYGMLRGWDEGYAIPSLGIAVHPSHRGAGLGELLMRHLHVEAWMRGATTIRLKVAPSNRKAVHLYQKLGYQFPGTEKGQLIGFLDLPG